uniref:VWFA domain-containing protein n=1 Tax=Periophthalmus magnuspinnatus TaxID=409849 RepID=A0A3B4B4L0_9GOBI
MTLTKGLLPFSSSLPFVLACCFQGLPYDTVKRDIVFLLDGSDNTRNGFPQIQQFVKSIVEHLSIDDGKDRVAVVQYADMATVEFHLSTYKDKSNLMDAIDKLKHKGGTDVNTGAAMRFTRLMVFTSSWGSRRLEGVPQILVVLTSQPSDDNVKTPAFALKEHEIMTVGVGVADADLPELETIAFKPNMVYMVNDYTMLSQIQSQVITTLDLKKDTKETLSGISDLVGKKLILAYMFKLHFAGWLENDFNVRDIVFLVDGSDDSRNGLPAIREFIRRMVEDIEDEVIRVAVVQYSDDTKTYFDLNSHKTKSAIVYAVRGLRHKGGISRNTGQALKFVHDLVSTPLSGSRKLEGVPQILILLTGGKSSDDVSQPAFKLKQMGVLIFAIGMKNTQQEELALIASFSKSLYNLPVFGELLSIQPEIATFIQDEVHSFTMTGKKVEAPAIRPPSVGKTIAYLRQHSCGRQ